MPAKLAMSRKADSNVCVAGYDLNRLLVERFFNCVAKKRLYGKSKCYVTTAGQEETKDCQVAVRTSEQQ